MPSTVQKPPVEETYVPPVTSPFYKRVISPACDWLCKNTVPRWISPDQLSLLGLACSIIGCIFGYKMKFIPAVIFWLLYSTLDNLDGKQARRLNMSTKGGDFLDHACDSMAVTLSCVMWVRALAPAVALHEARGLTGLLLPVAGQLPFFLGCWAHHIIGRVLLGPSTGNIDYFTVSQSVGGWA
eukprot:GHVU01178277.1.p1 GENE.GHVU01178277.1~~GHVU01178277.1.p1  ORF type:complete len:183 (-),score=20.29 GHVU01178277.1:123-671(-)